MIGFASAYGVLKTMYSISIGPCDDHKIRVLPGVNGGADFLDHFIHRDDLLSLHVPAFLGPNLVFNMQAGNACTLVLMNGTSHVDWVAIASISVRDERQVARNGSDDSRNGGSTAHHLAHGQQTNIGLSEDTGSRPKACHVDGRKSCLSDEAGAQGIICSGGNDQVRADKQFTQACSGAHGQVLSPLLKGWSDSRQILRWAADLRPLLDRVSEFDAGWLAK